MNKVVHQLITAFTLFLITAVGFTGKLSAETLNDDGSTYTISSNGSNRYSGSAQDFTIPSNTGYNLLRFNLRGGDGGYAQAGSGCKSNGGAGATTEAVFSVGNDANDLVPGGTIRFVVGKYGENSEVGGTNNTAGAGGGGTAVLYRPTSSDSWIILAVAGGGGGAHQGNFLGGCIDNQLGEGGRSTEYGSDGEGANSGSGGTNGGAGGYGLDLLYGGYGGGGAYGTADYGGGQGYPGGGNGGQSGSDGGFGFGGGGGSGFDGGGGGGGYSGGGGSGDGYDNGGGGGSYVNSTYAISNTKTAGSKGGGNSQDGKVEYAFENTTFTWTGAINHNWHNNGNWSPVGVPTSDDIVEINASANDPYIWSGTPANARVVRVFSGAELTVQPSGILNVYPYYSNGISNYGTITNDAGDIYISPVGGVNNDGILNEGGTFINKFAGRIEIEGLNRYGINNNSNANFTNQNGGTIEIGTLSSSIGNVGLLNESGSEFSNRGTLSILNTGDDGIRNNGTFSNTTNGTISIDHVLTEYGIFNVAGNFENQGMLTVGSTVIGKSGVYNRSNLTNKQSGTIIIENATEAGIFSYEGTFTNEGLVKIGENGSIGIYAILNGQDGSNPVFNNSGCDAVLRIFDNKITDTSNSFTNTGIILHESSASSNIYSNSGLILYNAGTFSADVGNTPVSVSGSFSGKKIWTACNSSEWDSADNWFPTGIPQSTDEVVIYPVSNSPVIGGTTTAQTKHLFIEDGSSLTNNGNLFVAEDFWIEPGATVTGNGQYDIGTNFNINGGTFNPGSSTVTLSGTETGYISNDSIHFYNLIIDKPSDNYISILSEVTVSNGLTITSGDLKIIGLLGGTLSCPHLYLTAGSDLVNSGSLTLTNGALWIQAGASAEGNGQFYISGNFIVEGGTYLPGTSTVTLTGSGAQTISVNPTNFYNLTINKPSGTASIGDGDVTVANELNMLSGNLNLNGANLELTGNGTIIGESPASYIYSSSGGVVKKTLDLNAPTLENPGNIGVTLTSAANLGATLIERGHNVQQVYGDETIQRYYTILPANNSGLNATVRFSYLDHELNGSTEDDILLFRFDGADWNPFPLTGNDTTNNWVEAENVDAFSQWTFVANCIPTTYYADSDGDGYGDPDIFDVFCSVPDGYVADNTDCNDNDSIVNPNPDCSLTTRTWTGKISTDWNEPCNWSPNCVPGATNNVSIPNVENDPVIFNLANAVAQSVNIAANAVLTIDNGGNLSINSTSAEVLSVNGLLVNNGEITLEGGTRGLVVRSELMNNEGAIINITNHSNSCLALYNSGTTVSNYGTINCYGTSQFGVVSTLAVLTNYTTGIFNVTGSFTDYAMYTYNGGLINQGGNIKIDGATGEGINVSGSLASFDNSGVFVVKNVAANAFIITSSSAFSNTGVFQGEGNYNLIGVALNGTVAPGDTIGTMNYLNEQTFESTGTIEMEIAGTTPGTEHDQIIVNGTATIGGTLNVAINYSPLENDRIVLLSADSISGTFSTVTLSMPYDWDIDYSVPGEVALVYAFTKGVWDGFAGDGEWNNPLNWQGRVLPGPADAAIIANGDAVTLSAGTQTVLRLEVSGSSSLEVSSGATLNVNSNTGDALTVNGSGTLTNNGELTITGGTRGLVVRSELMNNEGAIINITNHSNSCLALYNSGTTVSNYGTINCYGTSQFGVVSTLAVLTNYATGIFNVTGSFTDYAMYTYNGGLINQGGNIKIDGATGEGINVSGSLASFDNSGVFVVKNVAANAFIITSSSAFSNTGVFQGEGNYNLIGVALDGTVAPGDSIGTMNYLNEQTFESTGTIEMEIAGTTPGTEHDQIIVNGTATIGGTLNVTINYSPLENDRIVLLSADSISGTFSTVTLSMPYDWNIDYSVPGEVALVYAFTKGVWDGFAGDGEWNNPLNWQGRALPDPADAAIIANGDAVTLSAGTQTVLRLEVSGSSSLEVSSGAALNVNSNTGDALTVNGSGTLTNNGELTITGGTRGLVVRSKLMNNEGAIINITNHSNSCLALYNSGTTVSNYGTINCNGTGQFGVVSTLAILTNYATGIFNVTGSFTDYAMYTYNGGLINQDGNIKIDGATGEGTYVSGSLASFDNSGIFVVKNVAANAFIISSSSAFSNTGVFQGEGNYNLIGAALDGTVAPGDSIGIMNYLNDQTFESTGTIEMEIDGNIPGTMHDQVIVNGTATIGGTLNVAINYSPLENDRIVLLSATAISGTFGTVLPALSSDWELDYSVAGEVALQYIGEICIMYADNDGDGLGDPAMPINDCSAPAGYVANNLDCDDGDPDDNCFETALIQQIQETVIPGDGTYPSPLVDSVYVVAGTVSGVIPGTGFYMQEADGDWHGIWVNYALTPPSRMDNVEVVGTVVENNGRTELDAMAMTIVEVNGGVEFNPTLIVGPIEEKDESVVSYIAYGAYASTVSPGNYSMNIGFSPPYVPIQIGSELDHTPPYISTLPEAGKTYSITGPVKYSAAGFSISPRDDADFILDAPLVTSGKDHSDFHYILYGTHTKIVMEVATRYSAVVYNTIGQAVFTTLETEGRTEIPIPAGVYLVQLRLNHTTQTKKVVVR